MAVAIMTKPKKRKDKRRSHVGVAPGRPSNQKLYERITTLQQLVTAKSYHKSTWQLIERYMHLIAELEDQATPLRAATWDGGSPSAERPVLPGVEIDDHDRFIYEGSQFQWMAGWLDRQINWALEAVELRLEGRQPGPKPQGLPREIPTTPEASKTPRTA